MPKYIRPVDDPVSGSFAEHIGRGSANPGVDYKCGIGTPIKAPAGGRIGATDPNPAGGGGCMIALDTYDGDGFDFLHLVEGGIAVSSGQYVNQGQVIGYTGNTGDSTGPHLHLSFRRMQGSHFINAGNEDFELYLAAQAGTPDPTPIEEIDMNAESNILAALKDAQKAIMDATRRIGAGRFLFDSGDRGDLAEAYAQRAALILPAGEVFLLPNDPRDRAEGLRQEREVNGDGLLVALAERPDGYATAAYNRLLQAYDWDGNSSGLGRFIENTIALDEGAPQTTWQVYENLKHAYINRQAVWRDMRPVRLTLNGDTVNRIVRKDNKDFAVIRFANQSEIFVELTPTQVARADAQKFSGQPRAKA